MIEEASAEGRAVQEWVNWCGMAEYELAAVLVVAVDTELQ